MHAGGIVQEYQDERPTGGVTLVKEEERKGTVMKLHVQMDEMEISRKSEKVWNGDGPSRGKVSREQLVEKGCHPFINCNLVCVE